MLQSLQWQPSGRTIDQSFSARAGRSSFASRRLTQCRSSDSRAMEARIAGATAFSAARSIFIRHGRSGSFSLPQRKITASSSKSADSTTAVLSRMRRVGSASADKAWLRRLGGPRRCDSSFFFFRYFHRS